MRLGVVRLRDDVEVDDDFPRLTRQVFNGDLIAEVSLQLLQQGEGVVIVAKAHGFTRLKRGQCSEDGGVPETLGYAARIERVSILRENGNGRVCHDIFLEMDADETCLCEHEEK